MTIVIPAASFLLGMIAMGVIWLHDGRERTRLSTSVEDALNNLTEKEKWNLFYGDPELRMFSTSMGMKFKERPTVTVTPEEDSLYLDDMVFARVPISKRTLKGKIVPAKPKPVRKPLPKPPVAKPKTPRKK